MKNFLVLLLVTLAAALPACRPSANGSLSTSDARDPAVIENLGVLCRVWGYAKYHHPVFAADTVDTVGRIDADAELLALLPRVVRASAPDRNRTLAAWIDSLGTYEVIPELYDTLPVNRLGAHDVDLSWTRDTVRLGAALSGRLAGLRFADRRAGNRYATKMYYEEQKFEAPNAGFGGEKPYVEMTDPDCDYRLLAAFRFWNMVEYFFPSKYLTDKPWDDVLPEYTARMIALPDGSYYRTMWRMIAEVRDSHAELGIDRSRLFGSFGVPVGMVLAEGRPVVAAPGAGFQRGDEIVAVDGRPMAYFEEQVRTYIPCSNEARVSEYAAGMMLFSMMPKPLRIRYRRDGVERDTLTAVEPWTSRWLNRNYGGVFDLDGVLYINPAKFNEEEAKSSREMLPRAKGLLVDLRNYPHGKEFWPFVYDLWWENIANQKWNDLVALDQVYTLPNLSLPGTFASSCAPEPAWRRPLKSLLPIVILVDNGTQSAAETAVQSLQLFADATVVGGQSAGANGNVSYISLPGGIETCFSGLGWYYSDGVTVQRAGVRIDVETHPTVAGVKAGRDEILDAGMQVMRAKIAGTSAK